MPSSPRKAWCMAILLRFLIGEADILQMVCVRLLCARWQSTHLGGNLRQADMRRYPVHCKGQERQADGLAHPGNYLPGQHRRAH